VSKVLNVSLLEGTTCDTCCVLKRIICHTNSQNKGGMETKQNKYYNDAINTKNSTRFQ
jgi:hypothetical protein